MFRPLRNLLASARTSWRKLVAGGLLLVWATLSLDLPLPQPASEKDLSQPYPCMHRACGCRSAAECWKGCCCFTPAERLAWAKARGVKVPAQLVAAAERDAKAHRAVPQRSCCRTAATARQGFCGELPPSTCLKQSCGQRPQVSAGRAGPEKTARFVLLKDALRCQGHRWRTLVSSTVIVVEDLTIALDLRPLPQGRVAVARELPIARGDSPPVPPPRHAA